MLQDKEIGDLEKKLLDAKKSLENQLSKFATKDKKIEDNYRTDFPDIGNQADENAQEITEYEQNISLEHNFESELKLIHKALDKIKNQKYGKCEICGQEIPYERLKIRPQALMCVACKAKNETSL